MKIYSQRGSLLLHVTHARTVEYIGVPTVFYSYTGRGCGGYGPRESLDATIAAIKADAPRARIVGALPEPSETITKVQS